MKKIVLGIVAALVIAVLGLPPLLGILTESQVRNSLASMDENPVMALNVESYDRGWFSSTARVGVGIDPDYARSLTALDDPNASGLAAAMIADATLTFVVDLDHGPIVLRNGFYAGLSRFVARLDEESAVVNEIRTRFAMPYLVEIRGQLGFTGVFRYDADVPPVDFADESGEVFFSGLITDGTLRRGNLVTSGRIDEISFDSVGAAGQIRGISFNGDNNRVNAYLWTGPFEMLVDSVVFTNPLLGAEPMLNISGLRLAGDSQLDDSGELISGSVIYAADSFVAGQEFSLANAEISAVVTNLSIDALETYYETMLSLDPNDPLAALGALQTIGSQLFERNPTFALSPVRFEYNGEPFTAHIEVRTSDAAQGSIDFMNPMMLASLLEVSADATASKTLAAELASMIVQGQLAAAFAGEELPPGQDIAQIAQQQAEVMLTTFVGQGLIVEVGDNYTTTIEYANGEITVNGTPLPLGMMFQ